MARHFVRVKCVDLHIQCNFTLIFLAEKVVQPATMPGYMLLLLREGSDIIICNEYTLLQLYIILIGFLFLFEWNFLAVGGFIQTPLNPPLRMDLFSVYHGVR